MEFLASVFKILDSVTLVLVGVFIILSVNLEFHIFGLSEPFFPVEIWHKEAIEDVFWAIVIIMSIDLGLKYYSIRNLKKFAKKHWFDIVMLVLIPIFAGFKFVKIAIKLVKQLKVLKMGAKIGHKAKKNLQ